jgi:hypothetical protein
VLLPEKVLTILASYPVSPEVVKSGPVGKTLNGTPNDVPPDKTVIVSMCCFTCLLLEKSNFVLNAIFIGFIINIPSFEYIYNKT